MVQVLEEDKKKFDAADLNKDGALTKEEHVAFLYPSDFPHMHDIEMERVLVDHDKNGDGTITKEEFLADSGFYMKIADCCLNVLNDVYEIEYAVLRRRFWVFDIFYE
jgi:hypothetical protein